MLLAVLALAHIKSSSSLSCLFQSWIFFCPWSKMTLFLVVQINQQAVMKISLKMGLLKSDLACSIISRGLTSRFQVIGIVAQQSLLNGHSKKRWKQVSSQPRSQNAQLWFLKTYSLSWEDFWYSTYLLTRAKRKIYDYQDYLTPTAIWKEERWENHRSEFCILFCCYTLLFPSYIPIYHAQFHPSLHFG